jgi:hypothetical protein
MCLDNGQTGSYEPGAAHLTHLIQSDNKECKVKSRRLHLKGFGTTFGFGDLHRRANYRLHRRKQAERTATPLPYLGAEGERQQYQDERFICDSQDLTLHAVPSDGNNTIR